MKFQILNRKFQKSKTGFTLVEIIIVTGLALGIFLTVFLFGQSSFSFNRSAQNNLDAQSSARRVLKTLVKELRSVSPSSLGAYPIALASTTSVIFFSNIDSDAYKEQVRYFLDGGSLKRGVVKPSGIPLSYNPANETITTMIRDINNGAVPIFEYFDNSFTGTSTPLAQPVQATDVRLIRIIVKIEKDPNKSLGPFQVESQVFLRNLKDNL